MLYLYGIAELELKMIDKNLKNSTKLKDKIIKKEVNNLYINSI